MRTVDYRVIVQRDDVNKDKYYPTFLSAVTSETFPWAPAQARIEVNTNVASGTSGYISPIRVDDIVRLQVNVTYSDDEKTVWEDLYEGRIVDISSSFSVDGGSTFLECAGHSHELTHTYVTVDYSASSASTGTIIEALRALYLNRLSGGQIDTVNSSVITSYNVNMYTRKMVDVIRRMEQLEGYSYRFHSVRAYDSDGSLSTVYASWQPIPTAISDTLRIIEGTDRLISAEFSSSLVSLANDIIILGEDGSPQKSGTASDAASITEYDNWGYIETDYTLATDSLCGDIADELLARFKDPIVSGTTRIIGEVHVEPGDLIYCKIPSLIVNGESIDGNYRVRRVAHTITADDWVTDLDLGEIQLTASDVITSMRERARWNNSNFVS